MLLFCLLVLSFSHVARLMCALLKMLEPRRNVRALTYRRKSAGRNSRGMQRRVQEAPRKWIFRLKPSVLVNYEQHFVNGNNSGDSLFPFP